MDPYPDSDYSSPTDGATTASAGETGEKSNDSGDSGETALLPKSFFHGKELEVGHECKVKIEHVYDSEVEVSYVPESESKEDKEGTMESANDQLEGMAQDTV